MSERPRTRARETHAGMSKTSAPISSEMRSRTVARLATLAAYAVVMQAVAFIALSWLYRFVMRAALEAFARSDGGQTPQAVEGIAAAIAVVLDLFTALAVSFFANRWLLRSIVRATPHPMRPPTRPIPWAALSAAAVIVAFSVLAYAASDEPLTMPLFGWMFELTRDAAVAALFWFAATRVVRPVASAR